MKVEFDADDVKTMREALERWGLASQVGQAVEECAELIVALQKYINREPRHEAAENILDEIADVEIMLAQIRFALGISDDTLRERMSQKLNRVKSKYLNPPGTSS
ncbi:MAG: hypothetical protein FWE82_05805 [Defluviitaleaceae bacterium]|nr:hypothetical protein [Defluviitaleaceae bacterium]